MEQNINDHIKLLIKDGQGFEKINFLILFSFKRNSFFSHLGNYIDFYNRLKTKVKSKHLRDPKVNAIIERIPDLHFENYSLSPVTQFFLIISLPISFIIFILQWNYIKEVKSKLIKGLIEFSLILEESKGNVKR